MPLSPQGSIEHLRSRVVGYVRATGNRQDEGQALQASIDHAERALSNLSHRMGDDYELKDLYRQLGMEVETAKGTLRQQTTARR